MALQSPRRRAGVTIGLVIGVLAIFVGAWALHRWEPFADDEEHTDVSWPDSIDDLAGFVEQTTGLAFDQQVEVEFIDDYDDYAARLRAAWGEPDPRAETWAEEDEAFGRALGLWVNDIDLHERLAVIDDSVTSPAWWLAVEGVLVVNADEDDDLGADARVAVVSNLTEALLDQRYDLQARAAAAVTPQEHQVVLAMDIGHAQWVAQEYIGTLDADETEQLGETDDVAREANTAFARLPAAFRTLRTAASQAGLTFTEALYEEPFGTMADAYTDEWPDALDQLSLPDSKFLTRDPLEEVVAPRTPEGGEFLRARQLGPVGVFLMMAASIDASDALTASDGWGNDATTMYRLDGRICADSHIVADSPDDADRLEAGLGAWAYERPVGSDVLVGRDGVDLYLSMCDPGVGVRQKTPDSSDGEQILGRMQLIQTLTALTGQVSVAECVAVEYFAKYPAVRVFDDFAFDDSGEFQAQLEDCAATA